MILPDKHIKLEYSLLSCGAIALKELGLKDTISSLWNKCKKKRAFTSYETFILTLDYLFMLGAIKLDKGMIMRRKND